jgi:hypothetical protein
LIAPPLSADLALEPEPGRRKTVLVVLAVAAVVAVLALVMVRSLGSDKDVAGQTPPPKRPASAQPATAAPAPPKVETPEVKPAPSAPEPAATPSEPEKPEVAPERTQEPARTGPQSGSGKKPYRPRGI